MDRRYKKRARILRKHLRTGHRKNTASGIIKSQITGRPRDPNLKLSRRQPERRKKQEHPNLSGVSQKQNILGVSYNPRSTDPRGKEGEEPAPRRKKVDFN